MGTHCEFFDGPNPPASLKCPFHCQQKGSTDSEGWNSSAKTATTSKPCLSVCVCVSLSAVSSVQSSDLMIISSFLFVFVDFETGSHRTLTHLQLLILLPPCSKRWAKDLFIFSIQAWGLQLGLHICQASVLPLCCIPEPRQQTENIKLQTPSSSSLPQSPWCLLVLSLFFKPQSVF